MGYQRINPCNQSIAAGLTVPVLLCLGLSLTGCGGGDVASTSAAAPVAVPSATPTPTPTPTPPSPNSELPLTVSQVFDQAASGKLIATVNTTSGAVQDTTLPSRASFATLTITYDSTANTYLVADEASSKTFAPTDLTTGTASFDHYVQSVGSGLNDGNTTVSDLYLFRPGATNTRLALTYATYGVWSTSQQGATNTHFLTRFATYGIETASESMPRTGSATYSGIVDGLATVNNQAYRLTGSTGTVTANFATGVVRTALTLTGNPDPLSLADGTVALGALAGTGAISTGTSRFTGTISGLGATGSFGGGFFGPGAAETALAFSLTSDTASTVGVLVGKR